MYLLLQRFFQICLFQSSPRDLPASSFLTIATLIGYSITGLLVELARTPLSTSIAMVGVDLLILSGLSWVILWVRQLTHRYQQTLTALAGCGAILTLFAWPIIFLQDSTSANNSFVIILMWLWFFWQTLVFSHIISRALSTSLFIGTGLILIYVFVSYSVAQTLFFQPAAGL